MWTGSDLEVFLLLCPSRVKYAIHSVSCFAGCGGVAFVLPLLLSPATPTGLLSPSLTHHSLLVLMRGCDVPLLGEPTAELNKVLGNLCLRLAPWGERPASWHSPAEHITSPGSSKGSLAGGPEASGLQGQTASDCQAAHLWIPRVAPCPHHRMLANLTV